MRFFHAFALFLALPLVFRTGAVAAPPPDAEAGFRAMVSAKVAAMEKSGAPVFSGAEGWLFLPAEMRFLSVGPFWGAGAAKVSRSTKPGVADPLPAIVDFNEKLKQRGIALLLVPVPPKAAIFPDKLVPEGKAPSDPAPALHEFYAILRNAGVEMLDLTDFYQKSRETAHGPVFCKTDTHWSGAGCVVAAEAIAARIRGNLPAGRTAQPLSVQWEETGISGDLAGLLGAGVRTPGEKLQLRVVSGPPGSAPIEPDPASPVLLLGDSHTLVFHDFLAERAGLLDQLAFELGIIPDRIGTRGSGATAVRIDLYRRSVKDPDYLAKKKVVVWCFTAREFTESDQGWPKLPVAK